MMRALAWLRRRGPQLSSEQQARLERLPAPVALSERPPGRDRCVVIDLETSGFDLQNDQLLSIGAVAISDGGIDLADQFECTLQHSDPGLGASVLIHGLSPGTLAAGREPAEAQLEFLEWLGDSPLLAFHAGFDRQMLTRALRQTLGYRLANPFLDVAEMAPLLNPEAGILHGGLDDWVQHFGLQVLQRHHASADALVTAELALIMFSQARRQGIDSLTGLERRLAAWRRNQQGLSF